MGRDSGPPFRVLRTTDFAGETPAPWRYASLVFHTDVILDALAGGVRRREEALREEQAVYGLDALQEVQWHPILADALTAAGYRVLREQVYPHEAVRAQREARRRAKHSQAPLEAPDPRERIDTATGEVLVIDGVESASRSDVELGDGALPLPRERQRADLVLLPTGANSLRDVVTTRKAARRTRDEGAGTLFDAHATQAAAAIESGSANDPRSAAPEDAFWLEVKVVSQFAYTCGVPGPNATYASDLRRGLSQDLAKLAADRHIHTGAALLIHLAQDRVTAEHDLGLLMHALVDRGLPIQPPASVSIDIQERIGNSVCTLALVAISPLAHALA